MNIFQFLKRNLRCSTCQVDGIYGSLWKQFSELQLVEDWKFGQLYQCSKCQSRWFLPEHQQSMDRIHEKLWERALYWNQTPLSLEPTFLETLMKIGGVSQGEIDKILVPCSIVNISGERHEKALVQFSKQPPCRWYAPPMIHWTGEIQTLEPSDFTLPLEVRKASMEQTEIAMGFAPVGITNSLGEEATLPYEKCKYRSNNRPCHRSKSRPLVV